MLSFPVAPTLTKGTRMYITYNDFVAVMGADLSTADFNRYEFEAEMILDRFTTGIDNVKKLRVAFPTDEIDAEAVRRCVIALTDAVCRFDRADKAAVSLTGTSTGGVVSSVSSGSESISYATGTASSAMAAGVQSLEGRNTFYQDIIKTYLSGREDANGVNLMFMGRYPICIST